MRNGFKKMGDSAANYFKDFSALLAKKIRNLLSNGGIFTVFCNYL